MTEEGGGEQRAARTLEGGSEQSWDAQFCLTCLAVSWAYVSVSKDGGIEVGVGLKAKIKLPPTRHSRWLPSTLRLPGWTFPLVYGRRHPAAFRASSWLLAIRPPQAGLGDSAGGGKGLGAVFALARAQA